jgi:hypothetical protein
MQKIAYMLVRAMVASMSLQDVQKLVIRLISYLDVYSQKTPNQIDNELVRVLKLFINHQKQL